MQHDYDKHLDAPAEANTEKHINFLGAGENTAGENSGEGAESARTKQVEKRREQWQQGLEEGRQSAHKNKP